MVRHTKDSHTIPLSQYIGSSINYQGTLTATRNDARLVVDTPTPPIATLSLCPSDRGHCTQLVPHFRDAMPPPSSPPLAGVFYGYDWTLCMTNSRSVGSLLHTSLHFQDPSSIQCIWDYPGLVSIKSFGSRRLSFPPIVRRFCGY